MARDWQEWHRAYDDPQSSLSDRLRGVAQLIGEAMTLADPGSIRVLSLCAGDGRDLTMAATGHPRAADLVGTLVELDPELAARCERNIRAVAPTVDVVCGDAADPTVFGDGLPADLLVLVGIFGNIVDADILRTVGAVPAMCRPGSTVIWTRHRREPDLTPTIQRWFAEVGCSTVSYTSPGVGRYSIGCERVGPTPHRSLPSRLFTFRDGLG